MKQAGIMKKRKKYCSCGKEMKYHDENSDEPLEMDTDELEGSFWICSCGKIEEE